MEEYDTIIVGAGLSGCTLGKLLLEKKQKVLIIEKRDIGKKSKLCGGLITIKAYNLLQQIYGITTDSPILEKINGFEIKNQDLTLPFDCCEFYTVFREDLDYYAMNQYIKNGGKIMDKTIYEKIDFENKIIYANGKKYKYQNLVGADGIFSQVRKDLTHRQQSKNFALETYLPKNKQNLQIHFLDYFKGYTWVIPNPKNTIIGMGDIAQNSNFKEKFIQYFHLKEQKMQIRGAFLPTGNDILLEKNKVYFIGDAAGLISPITGEGIYYALISAYHLSNTMNSNTYPKAMKKEIRKIKKYFRLKKFVYNTVLRNYLFKRYNKSKFITKRIDIFAQTLL